MPFIRPVRFRGKCNANSLIFSRFSKSIFCLCSRIWSWRTGNKEKINASLRIAAYRRVLVVAVCLPAVASQGLGSAPGKAHQARSQNPFTHSCHTISSSCLTVTPYIPNPSLAVYPPFSLISFSLKHSSPSYPLSPLSLPRSLLRGYPSALLLF